MMLRLKKPPPQPSWRAISPSPPALLVSLSRCPRLITTFRDSRGLAGRCVPVERVLFGYPSVPPRGLADGCVLVCRRVLFLFPSTAHNELTAENSPVSVRLRLCLRVFACVFRVRQPAVLERRWHSDRLRLRRHDCLPLRRGFGQARRAVSDGPPEEHLEREGPSVHKRPGRYSSSDRASKNL